jgi:hypothetical protein
MHPLVKNVLSGATLTAAWRAFDLAMLGLLGWVWWPVRLAARWLWRHGGPDGAPMTLEAAARMAASGSKDAAAVARAAATAVRKAATGVA